jgi:hypothetical protein
MLSLKLLCTVAAGMNHLYFTWCTVMEITNGKEKELCAMESSQMTLPAIRISAAYFKYIVK